MLSNSCCYHYFCVLFTGILHALVGYAGNRPHIVFILADDLGYNDIGYHAIKHGSQTKTPFLDKLAADGIKLENYYVQPICTPTRSQLMSGRYQIHTGLQHALIKGGQRNGLPLDNKIIPEHLKNCGYDTRMVGKWHLGYYKKEYLPQNRGFNYFFGYLNGAEDYYMHTYCNPPDSNCGIDLTDSETGSTNSSWGTYSTRLFTIKAKEAIQSRNKSKPLFLYLAYQAVHFPLEVPEEYVKSFFQIKDKTRRTYAGMLLALDESVSNVTSYLNEEGILDDTVIIFSTDNGGHTDYGGNNWPLRGRKSTLWEGGIKGVGFITGKQLQKITGRGRVNNEFIHVSDWLPTLLTATNCPKLTPSPALDGFDQWNSILFKEKSPRTELLHNIDPMKKLKVKHPLIHGFDATVHAAIRKGPWKLLTGDPGFSDWVKPPEYENDISFNKLSKKKKPLLQLYHIDTDRYERHDLASQFPHVIHDMLKRLVAYNKTAVPARYPKVDPEAFPKYHGGYWVPWVK